ncbi:hypothetical protein IWW55_000868 [Coemansia sp. RSA 2706]|nr:hypothetical protein IWW55_000868 [Coemansia sp. RSA 2706]
MHQLNIAGAALHPPLRYAIAVTAMASANAPELVGSLARACETALPVLEMVRFVELSRESLLKMISTIGTPRVINGTAALMDAVSESIKKHLPTTSRRSKERYSYDTIRERGLELWRGVYSSQADKLERKIAGWNPELIEVIQTDLYGRLLSDCQLLDIKSTELCTIGALLPINVPSQLKSHVLGAERHGASADEIAAAKAIAELVCTQSSGIMDT